MFPKDAITQTFFLEGISEQVVTSITPTTILGVNMQQSGSQSETTLMCGQVEVAKNFSQNLPLNLIQFSCNDQIKFEKTGAGDDAFVSITYITRNIASSTEENFVPGFVQGFTYDGVVISILSMLIFSIVIYDFLIRFVRGSKIKQ